MTLMIKCQSCHQQNLGALKDEKLEVRRFNVKDRTLINLVGPGTVAVVCGICGGTAYLMTQIDPYHQDPTSQPGVPEQK